MLQAILRKNFAKKRKKKTTRNAVRGKNRLYNKDNRYSIRAFIDTDVLLCNNIDQKEENTP